MPDANPMTFAQMLRQQRKMLARIESFAKGGDGQINRERFDKAVNGYLNSRMVRAIAIVKAEGVDAKKKPIRIASLRARMDETLDWRQALALCRKRVRWHYQPKSRQRVRQICSLPTDLKAWNSITKRLIEAIHPVRPHIGDWRGRGRDHQIRELATVLTRGDLSIVVADVSDAFDTVQPDALYEFLDIPHELIRGALDTRSFTFVENVEKSRSEVFAVYPHYRLPFEGAIPQGLLQGSPASNAIFGVLLNDLPDHLPENLGCFVYCDNIVVVTDNRGSAQSVKDALVEYFARHPAGPFLLAPSIESLAPMGFDHLGYWFRWDDDRLWIGMTPKHYGKFLHSLETGAPYIRRGMQFVHSCFAACSEDALFQYEYEASELVHEV